jgi:hypothetical protein
MNVNKYRNSARLTPIYERLNYYAYSTYMLVRGRQFFKDLQEKRESE